MSITSLSDGPSKLATYDLTLNRVLLVGDTHGNAHWWQGVVVVVADRLGVDAIVQVGDFGYWPGSFDGDAYLELVRAAPVPVLFIDGNHENHPALRHDSGYPNRHPVSLGGSLWYLPRGSQVNIAGMSVLAVGGARSIDRAHRRAGTSWFWEEAVDADDLAAISGLKADILLAHDAPAGWDIPGLLPDPALPWDWRLERPACEEHRSRLREALDILQPKIVVHGHYHQAYDLERAESWGPLRVAGLSEDGTPGAFATLTADVDGPRLRRVSW